MTMANARLKVPHSDKPGVMSHSLCQRCPIPSCTSALAVLNLHPIPLSPFTLSIYLSIRTLPQKQKQGGYKATYLVFVSNS
jgi:hypothetical protein